MAVGLSAGVVAALPATGIGPPGTSENCVPEDLGLELVWQPARNSPTRSKPHTAPKRPAHFLTFMVILPPQLQYFCLMSNLPVSPEAPSARATGSWSSFFE